MNREQRKYTLERINAIASRKIEKLNNLKVSCGTKDWTEDEKFKFLETGEAKLKTLPEIRALIQKQDAYNICYYSIRYRELFNFPDKPKMKDNTREINERIALVRKEQARLSDTCMLGDAEELIGQLRAFEEKEF